MSLFLTPMSVTPMRYHDIMRYHTHEISWTLMPQNIDYQQIEHFSTVYGNTHFRQFMVSTFEYLQVL